MAEIVWELSKMQKVGDWLPSRGASLTVSCGYADPVGWMPRWRAFLSPLPGLASPRLRVPTACAPFDRLRASCGLHSFAVSRMEGWPVFHAAFDFFRSSSR